MRPNVEAGRFSYVVASTSFNIVNLGIRQQRFQVGPVIPKGDPPSLAFIGIAAVSEWPNFGCSPKLTSRP